MIDDTEVETTETLTLRLLNPAGGANLGSQTQATLSITDNDVAVPVPSAGSLQFAQAAYTANEPDGEFNSITVTRTGGSDGEVTVQYLTTGESTATAGNDYTGASGTLTWPAGDMSAKSLSLNLIDDSEVEALETVKFTLSNPTGGASLASQTQATLSITDNDVAVPVPAAGSLQFAQPAYTAGEGDFELNISVTRVGGSDGEASVQYLVNGATVGTDYTGESGTVTWAAGDETSKVLSLKLIDDSEVEATETLNLTLLNPTGAALGNPAFATLSIVDNDTASPVLNAGVLQFAQATYTANESDGELNLTVIRTGGSDGEVTVQYNTTDSGTALVDSDYTGGQGTLTWAAGDSADKSLTLKLIDDNQAEATELVTLILETPTGGASLGSPIHATVTIADNDETVSTPVTPPVVTTSSDSVTLDFMPQ
ncbi:MAG TPA: hypothetical protein ENI48_05535 [Thioploca sp.]|nr:hypothetical protein [Thioploca sp.]